MPYWYSGMPAWQRLAGRNAGAWLDPIALRIVGRFQIPISVLSSQVDGSAAAREAIAERLPINRAERRAWQVVAARHWQAREAFKAGDADFEGLFFGATDSSPQERDRVWTRWQQEARKVTQSHSGLAYFARYAEPLIPWNITPHHAMPEAAWDDRLPLPQAPALTRSQVIQRESHREYWLRWPAQGASETPAPIAHVYEPYTDRPLPTLIFCHGIGMEQELWGVGREPLMPLLAQGFRLVFPDAPHHSRRRVPGKIVAQSLTMEAPGGILRSLPAQAAELATLCLALREAGLVSRLALGGVSLGALTSQYALGWMRRFAPAALPDAALFVTTAESLLDATFSGALVRAMGITAALQRNDWSRGALLPWRHLCDPPAEPPLPPEQIHLVLGQQDQVLPFASGLVLAERWQIPEQNRSILPLGHFSVYISLLANPQPLLTLASTMLANP